MKIIPCSLVLISMFSITACQTNQDNRFHYMDPNKKDVVICSNSEDATKFSKRTYFDNSKASKMLAIAPKLKRKECLIVDKKDLISVDYTPIITFRLSQEGFEDYYSPLHELKKVKYKEQYYWQVR